jgi:excisionase family DNA binding protein
MAGMQQNLVSTSVAARELGIGRSTLQRWVQEGRIKPDLVTLGGQYRWDVDRLRAELRERRERDE